MHRLFVVLFLLSFVAPMSAMGQTQYGEGEAADEAISSQAVAFVESYIALFNARDPGAVNLTSQSVWYLFFSGTYEDALWFVQNYASPVTLFEVEDVRLHTTGHISVLVTYAGWNTPYTVYTQRWYLLPVDGGYIFDGFAYLSSRVPDNLGTVEVQVKISLNEGVKLSATELPAGDVLVYNIENLDQGTVLTTGIYILPEGMTVDVAVAALANDYNALEYVGPTPVYPGSNWSFAFLVEPGMTCLVQGFVLDENMQNPNILAGEAFVTTLTVE